MPFVLYSSSYVEITNHLYIGAEPEVLHLNEPITLFGIIFDDKKIVCYDCVKFNCAQLN